MAAAQTVGRRCSTSGRGGTAGVGEPHGVVCGAGAGRTMVGDGSIKNDLSWCHWPAARAGNSG
jgi:hypothetical protein